jgi:hypothetical protein
VIIVRDDADPYVRVETDAAFYLVSRAAAARITGDDQNPPLAEGAVDAYLNGLPLGSPDPTDGSAYVYSKEAKA